MSASARDSAGTDHCLVRFGGGAGIQADLKAFARCGAHGMSAIVALTAQNTMGVTAIHELPPAFVRAQINAVLDDIGADAAKTGMLFLTPLMRRSPTRWRPVTCRWWSIRSWWPVRAAGGCCPMRSAP